MSSGNGSAYADVTKKYLKGRIPFRVWSLSSLLGALIIVVNNLMQHQAILQGFFSVLFMNLIITIPAFLAQAHFVGLALQRKPKSARNVLLVVLMISWIVLGTTIVLILNSIYDQWNSGTYLVLWNFSIIFISWWILSLLTFKVDKPR